MISQFGFSLLFFPADDGAESYSRSIMVGAILMRPALGQVK